MYEVYELFVKTNEGDVKIKVVGLDKLPSIQMPRYNKVMNIFKQNNSNLAKQQIGNEGQIEINVLIGSDFYNDIIKNEKSTLVEKMRLMPSKLGLIPFGPYQISDNEGTLSNNLCTVLKVGSQTEILLKENLKKEFHDKEVDTELALAKLFAMNKMGENDSEFDKTEQEILEYFESNARYIPETRQYSVPLIFKNWPPVNLPTNKNLALKRFDNLKKQIESKAEMAKNVNILCHEERDMGFIEPVPNNEKYVKTCHYLAALLVERPGHPTIPLRRVWDTSAKTKTGTSLNQQSTQA